MAALATQSIYRLPEFAFLTEGRLHVTHFVDLDPQSIVGTVKREGEPDVPINETYFDNLLRLSRRSDVGVGGETVHDEEVRASNEIGAEEITLQPGILDFIKTAVSQMGIELNHPTALTPKLYKLLLYKEGDFFDDHIDNSHQEGMIMTLSVQLPMSVPADGGNLVIEGVYDQVKKEAPVAERLPGWARKVKEQSPTRTTIAHPEPGKMGLTLFYQDAVHHITEVKTGQRMTLVFDVVQEPDALRLQKYEPYFETFKRGIAELRKRGVKRVGFPANHIYLIDGKEVRPSDLKGVDRIGYHLFKTATRGPKQNVYLEGMAEGRPGTYFQAVLDILNIESGFGICYNEITREVLHDDNEEPETKELGLTEKVGWDTIALCNDDSGKWRVINPHYLMGDVVLLQSNGKTRLTFKGDEEIHTGNEGFSGEIYTNVGIFADI